MFIETLLIVMMFWFVGWKVCEQLGRIADAFERLSPPPVEEQSDVGPQHVPSDCLT